MRGKSIKVLLLPFVVLMANAVLVFGDNLEKGTKVEDWAFKDPEGKHVHLSDWPGRVVVIAYLDPMKADLNNHFTDALDRKKKEGVLTPDIYQPVGIADCKSTWIPDSAIRLVAAKKAKKYKNVVLFDYDAELRKKWGLKKNTCNIIIIDKKRTCQAVFRGRVPDELTEQLVQKVVALSRE